MDPHIPGPPGSPRLFRPRSVGEILTHALELYRLHWQNLIATVAIIVIPLSILQVLLVDLVIADTFVQTGGGRGGGGEGPPPPPPLLGSVLAAIAVAVISVLTWTILMGAIPRAAAGTF